MKPEIAWCFSLCASGQEVSDLQGARNNQLWEMSCSSQKLTPFPSLSLKYICSWMAFFVTLEGVTWKVFLALRIWKYGCLNLHDDTGNVVVLSLFVVGRTLGRYLMKFYLFKPGKLRWRLSLSPLQLSVFPSVWVHWLANALETREGQKISVEEVRSGKEKSWQRQFHAEQQWNKSKSQTILTNWKGTSKELPQHSLVVKKESKESLTLSFPVLAVPQLPSITWIWGRWGRASPNNA